MKRLKPLEIILIILSIITIVGVYTFASVCGSMPGETAPCHQTRRIAIIIAAFIAALSLINLFFRKKVLDIIFRIFWIVCAVALILTPLVIAPVCGMESMHCNSHTKPFLILSGILIFFIVILSFIIEYLFSMVKSKKGADDD